MSKITSVQKKWTSFKSSFATVHREIVPIDRTYVVVKWIDDIFNSLKSLSVLVAMGAVFQTALSGAVNSKSLAILAVAGFLLYAAFSMFSSMWLAERGEIFDALLDTHQEKRKTMHLATLDLGRLLDPAFKELSYMFDRRGMRSIRSLWQAQRMGVAALFGLVISFSIILNLDPFLGLLGALITVPNVVRSWLSEQLRRTLDEAEVLSRRQRNEANYSVSDARGGVTARLLSLTKPFIEYYEELTGILLGNVRRLAQYNSRGRLITGSIQLVCLCLFLAYFAKGMIAGKYTIVSIAAIFGSIQLLGSGLGQFGYALTRIDHLQRDYQYLERFFATKALVDEATCRGVTFRHTPILTFEDISFTYPGSGDPALRNCSLRIEPGEKVALVGKNGCGKTTLLRLIARVYLPSTGILRANDVSLSEVRQESWLGHAAMIIQDGSVAGMELARALTGKPLSELSEEELARLWAALEVTDAKRLVQEDPRGLGVWNGTEWSDGRGFSTGQEQRLLLAAGVYRALNPSMHIMLLDEPTANCDAEMKSHFFSALTKSPSLKRHTILVSMHDPLYLHYFDRVLHFENGSLAQDLRTTSQIEAYREKIALSLAGDL